MEGVLMAKFPRPLGLSKRQLEIAILIAHGWTRDKDIACRCIPPLRPNSVKQYVQIALHKFGLYDRTQLALFILKKGIVKLEDIQLPGEENS